MEEETEFSELLDRYRDMKMGTLLVLLSYVMLQPAWNVTRFILFQVSDSLSLSLSLSLIDRHFSDTVSVKVTLLSFLLTGRKFWTSSALHAGAV